MKAHLTISNNITSLKKVIASTCCEANRRSREVLICGASKTRSPAEIREAFDCGVSNFGENYMQEAQSKIEALTDIAITWHFIGRIQSNKTKLIADYFDWVQTVDRFSIAKRLSKARTNSNRKEDPLNICIQVNLDNEEQKAGVIEEELPDLVQATAELPGIRLRGLMAIPKVPEFESHSYEAFNKLKMLFRKHSLPKNYDWDTLSMGMSGDFKQAIRAGATIVRLGTSIFGPR